VRGGEGVGEKKEEGRGGGGRRGRRKGWVEG